MSISTSFARTAFALFSGPQNLSPERPNTVSTAEIKAAASNRRCRFAWCSERRRGILPFFLAATEDI